MIPKVLFENDGRLTIEDIQMGMAKVGRKEYDKTKYAIINKDGDYVTDYCYDIVGTYSEGYIAVGNDIGSYSDEKGNRITKAQYGLLDTEGNVVLPFEFQELGLCKEGLINAKKGDKWGFLSPDGKNITPYIYEEAHPFSEGLASVKKDGRFGFIDKDGNVVIDFKYVWTHDFSDGVCFVQHRYASAGTSLTYIDKTGKVVVRIDKEIFGKYGMPSDYNEGVMVLNRYKAVSKEGNVQFELDNRYRMKHFKDGLSCVYDSKTNKYGCVNTEGKFVIPCKYEDCQSMHDNHVEEGLIGVKNNKMWGIVNSSGKTILPQEYSRIYGYSDGRVLATKDNSIYSIKIKSEE